MRARTHFEDMEKGSRQSIIIDELPYQVNKANLLIRIGELVRDKKIEGISDLRDESDKSGMRVVIELRRGEVPEVVLNNLYKETQMQDTFGMNMVALRDGQPRLLNLKQMLDAFLRHRREVVTRRTAFELKKARERGHLLEGLAVALSNVDEVIALIKAAPTPAVAKDGLMSRVWRSAMVEDMLARASVDVKAFRPENLAPELVYPPMATACPMRKRRRFWNCACNGSRGWSRTRSSASTRRSWKRLPISSISLPSRNASPPSSPMSSLR